MVLAGIFFLLFHPVTFAQDSLATLPIDSSEVTVRTADPQTLESITSDEVFDYHHTAQNPETLWTRIQRWLIQGLVAILDNRWASLFIKIAFFATFGIVLVALINQILGGNIQSAFSTKRSAQNVRMSTDVGDFKKEDLQQLLRQALTEDRYSDAVRLLYLQSLQELEHLGLITLKPDKTNHDYLDELNRHETAAHFSRLTLFYEYVEYGDFKVEKAGYQTVEKIYAEFREKAGLR